MVTGGEIATTDQLENYPGFPQGISGAEFGQLLEQQAVRFGAEITSASIEEVDAEGDVKRVSTSRGDFYSRTLIIATGTSPRLLGVPGEEKYRGRGISFCATCDGFFFRGKKVAVVGGGDSAVKEALYLTRFAREVILIHRRDELRAVSALQKQILGHPQVKFLWDTVVTEFKGNQNLTTLIVKNVKDSTSAELSVDGVFIRGAYSQYKLLKGVETDPQGYIITSEEMETPGTRAFRSRRCPQEIPAPGNHRGC